VIIKLISIFWPLHSCWQPVLPTSLTAGKRCRALNSQSQQHHDWPVQQKKPTWRPAADVDVCPTRTDQVTKL